MTVTELSPAQLAELKQAYIMEMYDRPSWGILANADSLVPDEDVIEAYAGIEFTEDDFSSK